MTTVEMIPVYNFYTNFVSLDVFPLLAKGCLVDIRRVKKKKSRFCAESY